MTKLIIILCSLLSFVTASAQVLRKEPIREETLPEGQLVRVHVSGRNGNTSVVLQRADGYWVYIDQRLYGPFQETDILVDSPYSSTTDHWQFRGKQGGQVVLVVNGMSFGPFDQAWTPNISKDGRHWGALVKDERGYAVVVDGVITPFFDVMFYEGQGQLTPFSLDGRSPSTAPYFYGSTNKWVAVGYRNAISDLNRPAEFRIFTETGEGMVYDQVEDPVLMVTDPNDTSELYGFIQYDNFITRDGENLAMSVHLPSSPAESNHLWINHAIFGPYPKGDTSYGSGFIVKEAMAADGSNWVVRGGDETVYTKDNTLHYEVYGHPAVSLNGRSFSFNFIRDRVEYTYVNGLEIGPFLPASVTSFSASGEHWLAGGVEGNGFALLTSESGVTYGPYATLPVVVYKDENTWTGYAYDENQNGYAVVNGAKTVGPFQYVDPQEAPSDACFIGYQGNEATLVVEGHVRFRLPGVRFRGVSHLTASKGLAHWCMVAANVDGSFSFVDNGHIYSGLPAPRGVKIFSSENNERNIAAFSAANGQTLVVDGRTYGLYRSINSAVLSSVGQAWAASVAQTDGNLQLLLPGVTPISCDAIVEMKAVSGKDAVIYNRFQDHQSFPRINSLALGTFNQASIDCGPAGDSTVYLAVNEGDRLLKTYKIELN